MTMVYIGNVKGPAGPQGPLGGAMTTFLSPKVITLTDAVSIDVDASGGNDFRVTLAGDRTMNAPTNPADGQGLTLEIIQDATGNRTLSWTSGTGGWNFGNDVPPVLSTLGGKRDLVSFRYSSSASAWLYLGSKIGF